MPETANHAPFPLKSVFFASLIPALLGVFSGLLVLPTQISPDPASGLLTWIHFTNGGTWNTVPLPDPNNIAQTIEVAVTWWPPGQYLFLGLLNSAGLSFNHAGLLLAFLSTFSGSIGLAALGKELGTPSKALPWIAAALACSQYNLTNYRSFTGGEPLVMALWPWVAIIAWRLRNNNRLLICTLPIFFLIGSFLKHSFAIYAICILLFLWSERLMNIDIKSQTSLLGKTIKIIKASFPLFVVGIIYITGRQSLWGAQETPIKESLSYSYSISKILTYSPISPLTSIATLKDLLIRPFGPHTSILAFVSPLALILYIRLIARRQPLPRFLGITALTTVVILSTFHIFHYAISLEDRHYQQAGALFLVTISAYAFSKQRFSRLAHLFIIGTMLLGISRFTIPMYGKLNTQHSTRMEEATLPWLSREVREELISITSKSKNSIIAVPSQQIALVLEPLRHPSALLFFTHSLSVEIAPYYKGRVSQVTIVEPTLGQRNLKSRFVDYAEDEWTSYEIDGWTFWQVGYPEKGKQEESVEAGLGATES